VFSTIDFIDELLKFWSHTSILFDEQNLLLNKISYFSENEIEKIKNPVTGKGQGWLVNIFQEVEIAS
jgi:hypothetical protein